MPWEPSKADGDGSRDAIRDRQSTPTERESAARVRRGPLRALRHRLRPFVNRPLAALAVSVLPRLWFAYLDFVWKTSRVDDRSLATLREIYWSHGGVVALLWHEEVASVAYAYSREKLGFPPHTLASPGDAGEVITRMLQRCGCIVFRGGSTDHRSRRREGVLREMIDHMRATSPVFYGITVDGSKGPPYQMKSGGLVIARECGKPVALIRVWYRRLFRLRTWDRTAVPLPFNRIRYYVRGPYPVPADAAKESGLETWRRKLEEDLAALALHSYDDMQQPAPSALRRHPQPAKRP